MRVHEVWYIHGITLFYGHGAGHETDGYAVSVHFSSCRPG
jgi:hypothetical protein